MHWLRSAFERRACAPESRTLDAWRPVPTDGECHAGTSDSAVVGRLRGPVARFGQLTRRRDVLQTCVGEVRFVAGDHPAGSRPGLRRWSARYQRRSGRRQHGRLLFEQVVSSRIAFRLTEGDPLLPYSHVLIRAASRHERTHGSGTPLISLRPRTPVRLAMGVTRLGHVSV